MSRICKYYVRGNCQYGDRCRFLHENYSYKVKSGYSDRSNDYNNQNKNYSRDSSNYYEYNKNYDRNSNTYNYNKDYSRDSSSYYGYKENYNRYHVDNRNCNQSNSKHSELTISDVLNIIKLELKQFEEQHIWPLTVCAPIKEFGNIPGFKDFSPEEIRYMYHEACRKNSLLSFNQYMIQLKNSVMNNIHTFKDKDKSNEAYNIVKKIMQNQQNQNEETMTTESELNSASTSTLPKQKTFRNDMQSFSNSVSMVFDDSEVSEKNSTVQPSVFNNQLYFDTVNNCPNSFNNSQPSQSISTFSFNLSNLKFNQNSISSASLQDINKNCDEISDSSIYSKVEGLNHDKIEAFRATTFKSGCIPLVPPCKELCFN